MQHKVTHIASFFLDKAKPEHDVTNLKLQKLVYIALGWYTVYEDSDLYPDRIEAWRYGPVIPSLYYRFNGFENQYIKTRKIEKNLHVFCPDGEIQLPLAIEENTFIKGFLDAIFNVYIEKPAHELVDLTHGKATPWDKVYVPNAKVEIPKSLIRDYYNKLAQP